LSTPQQVSRTWSLAVVYEIGRDSPLEQRESGESEELVLEFLDAYPLYDEEDIEVEGRCSYVEYVQEGHDLFYCGLSCDTRIKFQLSNTT